jgi:hypothetical protein
MVSTVFLQPIYNIIYEVGTIVQESTINKLRIRNNTVNTELRVRISNPFFVVLEGNNILLSAGAEWQTNIAVPEDKMRQLIENGTKNITDLISIEIEPIDVTGPIFVQSNLDQLLIQ